MILYPYQHVGVKHLTTRNADPRSASHKLIADACGLGKTVQACAALHKVSAKSAIIVTPAPDTIKTSWRRTLIECGAAQEDEIQIISSGDAVVDSRPFKIINYEMLLNDDVYRAIYWSGWKDAVIIDEAQRLKGIESKRSLRILGGGSGSLASRGYWKWLLSGTIMPNRPIELYPILSALYPAALAGYESYAAYGKHFCGGFEGERGWNFNGASNLDELAKRIAPFFLRREIEDVYAEMPEVIERVCYIDLGDMDCDETNTPQASLRKEIGIAKIPYVLEYVKDRLTQNSDKLLVFVYHREVAERLYAELQPTAALIYGGLSSSQKQQAIDSFTKTDKSRVLIAQINVAGEGIDGLQHVCNNIIDAEPDWVAGGYEQRVGRLRRIGQSKPVDYVALVAENTLDDAIVGSRVRKQKNIDHLFKSIAEIQNKPLYVKENDMSNQDELQSAVIALVNAITNFVAAATPAQAAPKPEAKSDAKPANGNGKTATVAPTADSKAAAKDTKTESTQAAEKADIDKVRAAAGAAIIRLGESEETRQAVIAVVKKHGSKTGKADGVPAKAVVACIAEINSMAAAETEEAGEDDSTSFL